LVIEVRSLVILEFANYEQEQTKNVGTKDMAPTFPVLNFYMNGQFKWPFAFALFIASVMPSLLMVRNPAAETRSLTQRFSSGRKKRLSIMLGWNLRFVLRFE